MTREELIEAIRWVEENPTDKESDHRSLDTLLLKYIDDKEVADLFESIPKWYA